MAEDDLSESALHALETLSEPSVYVQVAYASTPDAARMIIESLPAVGELLSLGPEAGRAALRLLEREGEEGDDELTSIALYVLQRVPTEGAGKLLAEAFTRQQFSGLNQYLAAEALLTYADVEKVSEDTLTAATRAAEKLKERE